MAESMAMTQTSVRVTPGIMGRVSAAQQSASVMQAATQASGTQAYKPSEVSPTSTLVVKFGWTHGQETRNDLGAGGLGNGTGESIAAGTDLAGLENRGRREDGRTVSGDECELGEEGNSELHPALVC